MKKLILTSMLMVAGLLTFSIYKSHPAVDFINSLDRQQKEKTILPFDDQSKADWHYFPASMYPRAGIQLSELNSEQEQLLFELLQYSLSKTGYDKVTKIISLEDVLRQIPGAGGAEMRDAKKYHVAFYGSPEKDKLWSWSFEGHHISLNFTVLDNKMSIAPRFMGANPATIISGNRKGERILHHEEDLGFELINLLSSDQQKRAIFSAKAFRDIVTLNSPEVSPLDPVGIRYAEMNQAQQILLLKLIDEYLSAMPSALAMARADRIKSEELGEIRFGWAGGMKAGEGHYYRIQGKTFLVEFDNIQNNANHIHTVWRDFNGDFGRDLIKEHYEMYKHDK